MLKPGMQVQRYYVLRPLGKGGFCQTYEVALGEQRRVLKVLTQDYPKAIALFQREAKVLSQLRHPGIPQVEAGGYFVFTQADRPHHCLVMEKIPGQDLSKCLAEQNHRPITVEQALDWLRQLSEILGLIHRQQYFHRDIKPANIMVKPNGQLVLIDFGGVREVTESYLADQQADRTASTRLHSRGYTPLEQVDGHPVPQSDFFALGRTFVHLLTGKAPYCFRTEASTGRLLWRQGAPQVPVALADLLDQMMAPFPGDRPQTAQDILDQLVDLGPPGTEAGGWLQWGRRWWRSRAAGTQYRAIAVALGATAALGVMGLRSLGGLQPWELRAFDHLIALRPQEEADPRLLIITVDEGDIQAQDAAAMARRGSLADQALGELLEQLDSARLVGLNIYRDFPLGAEFAPLQAQMETDSRLVTVCKRADAATPGILPPPESPPEQVGLSDFLEDGDGILRRQLLFLTPEADLDPATACTAAYSFSAQLALRYLAEEGIEPDFGPQGNVLTLGPARLAFLTPNWGGYRGLDAGGGQVLVNYRATPGLEAIADQVSLMAVLGGQVDPELIRDRIVLIGVTAPSAGDYWRTPYNQGDASRVAGVYTHAHMISQVLSAALDQRPLLTVWPQWAEGLWILGVCLGGGGVMGSTRSRGACLGAGGLILVLLYGITWGAFVGLGLWLPLVPSLLGVAIAGAGLQLCRQPTGESTKTRSKVVGR